MTNAPIIQVHPIDCKTANTTSNQHKVKNLEVKQLTFTYILIFISTNSYVKYELVDNRLPWSCFCYLEILESASEGVNHNSQDTTSQYKCYFKQPTLYAGKTKQSNKGKSEATERAQKR